MAFEQGVYNIVSKRTTGTLPDIIGRFPVEDLSLMPKPIFALPDGVRPQYPHWIFQPQGDKLAIRAANAPVTHSNGKLVAALLSGWTPEVSWMAFPAGSPNEYTIELPDRSAGWVVSDESGFGGYPVEIKPLSGAKKDTEVFVITAL